MNHYIGSAKPCFSPLRARPRVCWEQKRRRLTSTEQCSRRFMGMIVLTCETVRRAITGNRTLARSKDSSFDVRCITRAIDNDKFVLLTVRFRAGSSASTLSRRQCVSDRFMSLERLRQLALVRQFSIFVFLTSLELSLAAWTTIR